MSGLNIKKLAYGSCVLIFSFLFPFFGYSQNGKVVIDSLAKLGFENLCWGENEKEVVYVLENIAYRLNGVGLGKAVDIVQKFGMDEKRACRIIVLDNNIPKISLLCNKVGKEKIDRRDWDVSYDLGESWEIVKGEKRRNSSLYKVDVVVYPEFSFRNIKLSVPYEVLFNLSPAIEASLWRGSKLTAQLVIPIVNQYGYKYDDVRPGFITLSQSFRLPHNIFLRTTVGLFNVNRWGADVRGEYNFKNERFWAEARLSYTGWGEWGEWRATDNIHPFKYGYSKDMFLTGSIGGGYYWKRYNTKISIKGERYLEKEYGARFDAVRFFKYCAIGVYGMYVPDGGNKGINGGFRFQIALPPYRYKRSGYIPRVLPSRNWGFAYNAGNEFIYGKGFKSQPSDNVMEDNRFNPIYIKSELLNF